MRGEHSILKNRVDNVVGSSPHARGAHILASMNNVLAGIIPACAGSTNV